MVIALEVADVVEFRIDSGAERAERTEILRRAGHIEQTPRGDLPLVHLERLRAVETQFVVEHRAAAVACEVEVDVVGEVHYRRLVRAGAIGDFEGVLVVEVEDRLDAQFARITLVAVLGDEGHHHAVRLDAALPYAVGEVVRAAVEVVHAVVHLEGILLSLDGHPPEGDAVGAAAHALSRGGSVVEVAFGMPVSEHDVGHAAFAVGHRHRDDRSPVIREPHLCAPVVAQRVEDDRFALRGHAPDMLFDLYHIHSAGFRLSSR